MRKDTFQKALMATAKITCCAGIFGLGCDSKTTETGELTETQECQEVIADKFPDSDETVISALVSKKVKDCCTLVAEYYDELALQEDGSYDWSVVSEWEQRDQCCEALDWDIEVPGCTPWGPPMPPKLKSAKIHRPKQLQNILVRSV